MNRPIASSVSSRSTARKMCFPALALLTLSASWSASAAVLSVPGTYLTIGEAVNAANPGDTILIAAGSYGPAFVNKSRLTIAADGSGPVTITIPGAAGNFLVLGASQVALRDLSFDGVGLVAASGANVSILNVSIVNAGLTVAQNSFAVVSGSSVAAAPRHSPSSPARASVCRAATCCRARAMPMRPSASARTRC